MQLPAGPRSERVVKRLLKPAKKRAIDESVSEIPDAAKVIDKLTKRVEKLEKRVKALELREEEWWASR